MTDADIVVVKRPMQWGAIPDISETKPLSANERDCLREIRDVLVRHDCLGLFGVSLIHKHFDIGDDEVMLETIDVEGRTLTSRPILRSQLSPTAVETQWQLDTDESSQACDWWCDPPGGHARKHQQKW